MEKHFRFTYEIAPVYILMEKEVISRMVSIIGWEHGDAIFAPGLCSLLRVFQVSLKERVNYKIDWVGNEKSTVLHLKY